MNALKTEKRILIAFLLNLIFAIVEFIGGLFTGSIAIISDAVHDFGDSISIGASYFLEKISNKAPDNRYTYGYRRYSVLGSILTTFILLFGSAVVIYNAVYRLLHPVNIHYDGMLFLAVVGTIINLAAAFFTHGGGSLNQRSVNLHMLEDVLGWIVVLIGSLVMKFTNWVFVDSVMSLAVAVFILFNALKTLKTVLDIFLEKTPDDIHIPELTEHLLHIDGVTDVHHFHIRSIDGYNKYATLHVVSTGEFATIKQAVKAELAEHGIAHTTVEMEQTDEHCCETMCIVPDSEEHAHTHSHHHH